MQLSVAYEATERGIGLQLRVMYNVTHVVS